MIPKNTEGTNPLLRYSRNLLYLLSVSVSTIAQSQVKIKPFIIRPCDDISITSPEKIDLTEVEHDLICGNPGNPGWKDIPHTQAAYFIRLFLNARGYWNPKFDTSEKKIDVDSGIILNFNSFTIADSPVDLSPDRYWYPRGKPLTPALLDTVEAWAKQELSKNGYPCANAKAVASQITGNVHVTIAPGPKWNIEHIDSEGIPGILGGVERRYDAFDLGDVYNSEKFELTSQRIIANDLAINSSFSPVCTNSEPPGKVNHSLTAGPPRMVSFGFGFDTEEYAIAQVLWKNGRMFSTGSPVQAQASASYVLQRISMSWNWYYLPFPSRHYLDFFAGASRSNERRYEEISTKIGILPAWENDVKDLFYRISVGPTFEVIETKRGLAKEKSNLTLWETRFRLTTHAFEFYQSSPRSGHEVELGHKIANVDFGSNVSTNLWRLDTTHLWNIAQLDPPIFILGIRSSFASTSAEKNTDAKDLPASFRHHLGGVENLRGFGRNALPNDDQGALTTAYVGTELRLNNILPYKLQPIIFVDNAFLGDGYMAIDTKTQYWSPGFGTRWESPIGSMRFSLAHGLVDGEKKEQLNYLQRWQFYFSFGDQF